MSKKTEKKEKEIVVIVLNEFPEKPPSNFYVINAMFEYVFFKTKFRAKAQERSDGLYGKGKYSIRVCGF